MIGQEEFGADSLYGRCDPLDYIVNIRTYFMISKAKDIETGSREIVTSDLVVLRNGWFIMNLSVHLNNEIGF